MTTQPAWDRLTPMPADWHARAPWQAKQRRANELRRLVRDLAAIQPVHVAAVYVRPDPEGERHWRELGDALGVYCTREDCGIPSRAMGLCDTHYRQMYHARRSAA